MTKAEKAAIALGGLTLALGLSAGICFDLGAPATGMSCLVLAFLSFMATGVVMSELG